MLQRARSVLAITLATLLVASVSVGQPSGGGDDPEGPLIRYNCVNVGNYQCIATVGFACTAATCDCAIGGCPGLLMAGFDCIAAADGAMATCFVPLVACAGTRTLDACTWHLLTGPCSVCPGATVVNCPGHYAGPCLP